jgi:predicted nucleic acid-binding Zn ribbon protein
MWVFGPGKHVYVCGSWCEASGRAVSRFCRQNWSQLRAPSAVTSDGTGTLFVRESTNIKCHKCNGGTRIIWMLALCILKVTTIWIPAGAMFVYYT